MWVEANERIELVSPKDLAEEIASGEILLLDVRLPIEIERRGTIPGSLPVPRQVVEWWADPDSPYFRPDGVFYGWVGADLPVVDASDNASTRTH
jgi:rhodanese-related sulfurtransferase